MTGREDDTLDSRKVAGYTNMKVDIGILKTHVSILTTLCNKMDSIIEKLMSNNEKHVGEIYSDLEKHRLENETEVKEIHNRIDNVIGKIQETEIRILDKMESLHNDFNQHKNDERVVMDKLNQWKYLIVGGILVISWLISHINFDTIVKIFSHP